MQKKVEDFNKSLNIHKIQMPVSARLLDISSELGELNKEFLKATKYGTQNFEVTKDFILEYGDVLYALLSLANETNIDANTALEKVLKKYEARKNKSNSIGSESNI